MNMYRRGVFSGAGPQPPAKVYMADKLVIVESPSKAKTIQKYLGRGYRVEASMGHVRDLPKSDLGVDVEGNFTPVYEVSKGKEKVIATLKKSIREAEAVYLATDPDREGEAIAWHILQAASPPRGKPVYRVVFNEITPTAVRQAIASPRQIDANLVDAQQARRILDRLVGYKLSPLLWDKVKRGISAGRVQSVAVRLVVEREREITAFVPQESWTIEADLLKQGSGVRGQESGGRSDGSGIKPHAPSPWPHVRCPACLCLSRIGGRCACHEDGGCSEGIWRNRDFAGGRGCREPSIARGTRAALANRGALPVDRALHRQRCYGWCGGVLPL